MGLGLGLGLSFASGAGPSAPTPTLTSLNYAQADTGDSITITGTDLGSAISCTVGGTSATITGNTSTTLTFTMPSKAAGSYNVVVTTAGGASNALSIEAWSLASLSLTMFQRSFTASPWAGTASAGSSGTASASEGTHPPSASGGDAVFNGTNSILTATGTLDTYVNAAAYSGWALVNVTSISTNAADNVAYGNVAILSSSGGDWGVYLRSSGVVGLFHYDGSVKPTTTPISTGALTLAQWKHTGTAITIRTNGGSWSTPVAAGSLPGGALGASVRFGTNYAVGQFLNGSVREIGQIDSTLSDATFDKILAAARAHYGVALT